MANAILQEPDVEQALHTWHDAQQASIAIVERCDNRCALTDENDCPLSACSVSDCAARELANLRADKALETLTALVEAHSLRRVAEAMHPTVG